MRIFFDNVNFSSSSGPNSFGKKLAVSLSKLGHTVVEAYEKPDVQLAFIQASNIHAPVVHRLDGVWFNSEQDWETQNTLLKETYDVAHAVIAQSFFDKKLIEKFFGEKQNIHVIHNGADAAYFDSIEPFVIPFDDIEKVWTCASSWRPHKRLAENIRYFLEHAGKKDILIIAGDNPSYLVADHRIFYAGALEYDALISLYKATDYFLHLAWLDHCPNVVVDARTAGCHIICTNSGGTHEIAGDNSTIIEEDEWDFKPCKLYEPPVLDFSKKKTNTMDISVDISDVAKKYEKVLKSVLR